MSSPQLPAGNRSEWMVRTVSLGVLLALIIILGMTFYQVIAPFLLPLFLAAIMAIVCQPLHRYVLGRTGHRSAVAAGVTTGLIVGVLMLPLLVMTIVAAGQLLQLTDQVADQIAAPGNQTAPADPGEVVEPADATAAVQVADHPAEVRADLPPKREMPWRKASDAVWEQTVDPLLAWSQKFAPLNLNSDKLKEQFDQSIISLVKNVGQRTFQIASSTVGWFISLLVGFGMFLVALYYFLADGKHLLQSAERLIPVQAAHQQELAGRFATVVRAVVLATFMAAFVQGLATALALQVCGLGHFVIFFALASVAALIPLAGTWIVWAPCAVWLATQGHVGAAIGLTVFGIVVVGLLDNVVRTYVLNSDAELHPLLAFVSVLGALQVMGLWGVFIGPIVASCLYALVRIFNAELDELAHLRKQSQPILPIVPSDASEANSPPVVTP